MKVFLKVRLDASPIEEGARLDPHKVAESVQEAVENALWLCRDRGYNHVMADEISVLPDYVEIVDTDED